MPTDLRSQDGGGGSRNFLIEDPRLAQIQHEQSQRRLLQRTPSITAASRHSPTKGPAPVRALVSRSPGGAKGSSGSADMSVAAAARMNRVAPPQNDAAALLAQQSVSRRRDGKKRIAPVLATRPSTGAVQMLTASPARPSMSNINRSPAAASALSAAALPASAAAEAAAAPILGALPVAGGSGKEKASAPAPAAAAGGAATDKEKEKEKEKAVKQKRKRKLTSASSQEQGQGQGETPTGSAAQPPAAPWGPVVPAPTPIVPLPNSRRPMSCHVTISTDQPGGLNGHGGGLSAAATAASAPYVFECQPQAAVGIGGFGGLGHGAATLPSTFDLVCSHAGVERWRTLVHGQPTTVAANVSMVAVGCGDDGSVHTFDFETGARLLPAMVLGGGGVAYLSTEEARLPSSSSAASSSSSSALSFSPPVSLSHLLAITANGKMRVWDLSKLSKVCESTVAPIVSPADPYHQKEPSSKSGTGAGVERKVEGQLRSATVSRDSATGALRVMAMVMRTTTTTTTATVASNGLNGGLGGALSGFNGLNGNGRKQHRSMEAYSLHGGLGCWLRVADTSRFVFSDFTETHAPRNPFTGQQALPDAAGHAHEPLAALQSSVTSAAEVGMGLSATDLLRAEGGLGGSSGGQDRAKKRQQAVTRAHLEARVASAALVGSGHEFRVWVRQYARWLSAEGDAGRLRGLCARLLGTRSTPRGAGEGAAEGAGEGAGGADEGASGADRGDRPAWWNAAEAGACGNQVDKRGLLRSEVLPAIAEGNRSRDRTLQRLYTEYSDALQVFDASSFR